jgi:hypothetical protein
VLVVVPRVVNSSAPGGYIQPIGQESKTLGGILGDMLTCDAQRSRCCRGTARNTAISERSEHRYPSDALNTCMWEVFALRIDRNEISTRSARPTVGPSATRVAVSATAERAVFDEKLPGVRRALCDCSAGYATFASTVICIVPR